MAVVSLWTAVASPALAAPQDDDSANPSTQTGGGSSTQGSAGTAQSPPPDPAAGGGRSGYVEESPPLEGPDSVVAQVQTDDIDVGGVWKPGWLDGVLDPWWATKKKWHQDVGLKLNVTYQTLRQGVDQSEGEDTGAAYRAQIQGVWTLVNRKGSNPGSWSFRYEYRDTLASDIPPSGLAGQAGILGQTATGFNDFGSALSEFSWRQTFFSGKLKGAIGKISATSWYNAYILASPMTGFQNVVMQSSNSKAAPGRGIGAGFGYLASDEFVIVAGIHDANAKTTDNNPFDTLEQGEFFESIEFRYLPSGFKNSNTDQIRFQVWHQDERKEAGLPSSSGVTALGSWMIDNKWLPFAFGGVSDGNASIYDADFTIGVGRAFNTVHRAARDVLGLGYNWARPSSSALRDQFTWELFYRLQLVQNIAFTASTQLVIDPALNTDEDSVWLGGMKVRFTF